MLPEDFELRSRYGRGRDWPLGYQAVEPWYRQAERAIGVAADVAEQTYHGMGHFAGTHVMGEDPGSSVVDVDQRSWEHRNLFLVGSGSFPTMGTSNPTLTMAALALRIADRLTAELRR